MTFEAIFMKITYSTTTKLRLLSQFQNINESLKVFADYHNVGAGSLKRWIQQYLTGGLANLERPVHNRRYPKKLKLRAVHDYRNHRLPTREILLKYDIRGLSQLRNWVILYNNGKEPVRKRVRKMGRKVSYDEKIEIVKWVLKHNHDYKQAAQKFDITYSRAYAWTQKYEQANDWTALKDRRGKTRGRQPADREEQLLKEIRDLKAKLREREVQIAFSKKLIEISNREVKRPNDIKRFKK